MENDSPCKMRIKGVQLGSFTKLSGIETVDS
jgi:hypothetical protein